MMDRKMSKVNVHEVMELINAAGRISNYRVIMYNHSAETVGVSQCRGKLVQSHYFKDTTSSSAAEGLFQCPGYLELYRGRRTSLWDISRLHMCRLRGLKIPTMLCAQTNFPNLWRKM